MPDSDSVSKVFLKACTAYHESPALRYKQNGSWHTITWFAYKEKVLTAAKAFCELGIEPGRCVAILSENNPHWFISYLGAILAGAVPVGIYTTCSSDQCGFILRHSEAELVVVENELQLTKILEIIDEVPKLRKIIQIQGYSEQSQVMQWGDLQKLAKSQHDETIHSRIQTQKATDLCTLIYTSGTTGSPKGVMLTHENLVWTAKKVAEILDAGREDVLISYLPLSHIAEQIISLHFPLHCGAISYFAESLDKLGGNLTEVRPTIFVGVPRVWEKIQSKIIAAGAQGSPLKRMIATWAKRIGLEGGYAEQVGRVKPWSYPIAEFILFSKVKTKLGLDRCRLCGTTAAPTSMDTLNFFLSLGIPLLEVYGMSECTGPATLSLPHRYRTGKAGLPLQGTEIKIAPDGEVLIRGKHVFKGYYKDDESTAQALDDQGWLHTGDIGELDSQGFLSITDRKKELIITSGGKNIAPQKIEGELKSILGVSQAVIIGNDRPYLIALICLAADELPSLAEKLNSAAMNLEEAASCDAIQHFIQERIQSINTRFSRPEQIKKFTILPLEFTIDGGELTPTMKIKRRVVLSKYAEEIETLYRD